MHAIQDRRTPYNDTICELTPGYRRRPFPSISERRRPVTYQAPLPDMSFALKYGASLLPALDEGFLGDLTMDDVEAVLAEAGRMAAEVLAPLDRTGDRVGASIKDGVVTTAPGWKEAYDAWRKGGWNGLASPAEWGGQGLPQVVNAACTEMWNGACMAFGVGPLLTMGAIDALNAHGSDTLKRAYLEKLVTGEWTGTMHLTEPQAGSAVGAPGARNDVRAHSIEHKLGIHGSPTCTMVFGDHGGATGFLIGEENAGMACMFTMMNRARLAVGLQGVGIAERATQQATAYARERKQGRATGMSAKESAPIIAHPDVRRMLITMRALTQAARSICYTTALALDRAERGADKTAREAAHARASLLTPLAKAFSSDIGIEVTSLGVQVHGGMGFIEETGAAQLYRDARIAAIYEGTNGIQAIDLVTRKLPLLGGAAVETYLAELRGIVEAVNATNDPALGWSGVRLEEALASLTRSTQWMLTNLEKDINQALAGATPYLRLFSIAVGGCLLAQQALAALRLNAEAGSRSALARFFAENIAVQAGSLERTIIEGGSAVLGAEAALAE